MRGPRGNGQPDALGRCVLPPGQPRPVQGQVRSVNQARGTLLTVLRHPSFAAARTLLREDDGGTGAYNRITQAEYQLALQQLAKLSAKLPPVSADTLRLALRTEAMPFTFIIMVEPHVEIDPETGIKIKIPGGKFERKGTLKGYAGPALSAADQAALVAYGQLAGGGPERDFRLGLLRAECRFGLGDPRAAPAATCSSTAGSEPRSASCRVEPCVRAHGSVRRRPGWPARCGTPPLVAGGP